MALGVVLFLKASFRSTSLSDRVLIVCSSMEGSVVDAWCGCCFFSFPGYSLQGYGLVIFFLLYQYETPHCLVRVV